MVSSSGTEEKAKFAQAERFTRRSFSKPSLRLCVWSAAVMKEKKRNRKFLNQIYNTIHTLTIEPYNVQISNYRKNKTFVST